MLSESLSLSSCRYRFRSGIFLVLIVSCCARVHGQDSASVLSSLKKLSLEELLNVELEVFSVSKRAEKLTEVASAIQVITGEEIRRSTATSIPEALRLLTNLQVSQITSEGWIISARGFNALFSNKLLVMIDGRTVYSPLFAGVFWDAQNVLLEDVERIEVVSGPGGTLWGANAVNGVINIITKNSKDSQGWHGASAVGSFLKNYNGVRYGGSLGKDFSYRIYLQRFERGHSFYAQDAPDPSLTGLSANDDWDLTQGGFRLDYAPSEKDNFVLQGDFYGSDEYNIPEESGKDGQNVLARWSHTFSERSDFIFQLYYDATWLRDNPGTVTDDLKTFDLDFQHRLNVGNHNLLWGAGYRLMKDVTQHSTPFVGFLPEKRDMDLFSSFIQDEITITNNLKFIAGSKFLHNEYTGFEIQPSVRFSWIHDASTIWTALSRNVRTPSRIDVDYYIPAFPVPPDQASVAGGPNFVSEKVIAYELGYRMQPSHKMSFSLAFFYNDYDDLYSVESVPGTLTFQIMNGSKGNTKGAEFTSTFQLLANWRIRAGYTYFLKELASKTGNDEFDLSILGNDAKHLAMIHSMINLPLNFQFDLLGRYTSKLPKPEIPEYLALDIRLGWTYREMVELSLCGQNLLKAKHQEFPQYQIPRNIYGKVAFRF